LTIVDCGSKDKIPNPEFDSSKYFFLRSGCHCGALFVVYYFLPMRTPTGTHKSLSATGGRSASPCYDIVIIGAGPAGLNAGLHVIRSDKKPSVLLIDKIAPWEHPIQCAEAVGRRGLEEALTVKQGWIRQVIHSACFHAPDNSTISYTDKNGGYIIDRAAMQADLGRELAAKGVETLFNRRVTHLALPQDGFREVVLDDNTVVRGRVVVDASGPIAGLARDDKIARKPGDLEPAYFIHARSIDLPDDTVHIYAGRDLAPGGYAWVFPRGRGAANIGVLVGSGFRGAVNIRGLLDAFLARHFPSITIVNRYAGAIPCGFQRGPVAASRLIKAGDAASTVNPISRAGISEALLCGGLAGDHALLMLETDDAREHRRIAKAYAAAWYKKRGNRHEKLSRVKNSLISIPDVDYIRAANALSRIPVADLTMAKIFRTALGRFPRLVWALRHLM
jgi:geranylgeranyl reductase family protein